MKRSFLYMAILLLPLAAACSSGDDTRTWQVKEITFASSEDYSSSGADEVWMDVEFTNSKTGEKIVRPAFWDGGGAFTVRFAPTASGRWKWRTSCKEDPSLDGKKGSFTCKEYDGDLEIYRHGFVKVVPGRKYMEYADGTPFFYLGDTHWGMYTEEYDEPGPHAGETGAESHFRYIVDKRVQQGFTVYQSEPIGAAFNLTDGKVDQEDIPGFQTADKYYGYIAGKGLVHANAEFFFASAMNAALASDDKALENISRYWVARFGAYPVFWTLAQEIDNDFYYERGDQRVYDYSSNPWVKVAEYLHKHDAYSHPLSGHQENSYYTTVTGRGVSAGGSGADGGGASVFADEDVAKRAGHNWWAVQWSPSLNEPVSPEMVLDYWESSRPAINYEGRYCGLWTKDFGSRAQGWVSFLSGFFGYGYGAIDIWLYKSSYDINSDSHDGVDLITKEDKLKHWSESVDYPSANQMIHLRNYLESFNWWDMEPVLPGDPSFSPKAAAWAHAKTPDGTHVLYFFSREHLTGTLGGLAPGLEVEQNWYNPRTGQRAEPLFRTVNEEGKLVLPDRPDTQDWVLMIKHHN
ncbi:MAG: DUF4038 domain-containing protein [Bacteroidales bacterium]|nr:DUF4038 domain-containing protein [Bacteroidales bacterium]